MNSITFRWNGLVFPWFDVNDGKKVLEKESNIPLITPEEWKATESEPDSKGVEG